MNALRRNPLLLVLAVVGAVLVAVLAAELFYFGTDGAATRPVRGVAAEAKLLPPVQPVVAEQAYAETTTRPLFLPTRRPAPEVPATPPVAIQRGQFQLQGVIVVGTQRTAMLREKASGRIHRVAVGNEVNGMKVVQVDPTVVTLAMGEEREIVPLAVQRAGGAPAPGVPAPAAPPPPAAGGPFGAPPQPPSGFPQPAQPGVPGAPPVAAQTPGAPPGSTAPFARGPQPFPTPPATGATPAQPGEPQATTAPMTPEELLARRRARRAQQNQ